MTTTKEHPVTRSFEGMTPRLSVESRIAPGVVVVGDVEVGAESSLWWGVIIRGDDNYVRIGERTNIQDGTIIHTTYKTHPTSIGDDVTVGHGARLHGCTIEDGSLVGIGAILLDGAIVESTGFLAAGSVLTSGKVVRAGEIWAGNPARKLRNLLQDDLEYIRWDASHYVCLAAKSLPKFDASVTSLEPAD